MAIVMNMSSYAVEEASSVQADKAGHVGWNPQLELATQQHLFALADSRAELPLSLLSVDAEQFLQKMHAYRC